MLGLFVVAGSTSKAEGSTALLCFDPEAGDEATALGEHLMMIIEIVSTVNTVACYLEVKGAHNPTV